MPSRRRHREITAPPGDDPVESLSELHKVVDTDTTRAMLAAIFDSARTLPLLVVTTSGTGEPNLDLDRLRAAVTDAATIWFVTRPNFTFIAGDALPEGLNTFNGSVRLWWPDATRDDDRFTHPLFATPGADSDQEVDRIVRALVSRGFYPTPADPLSSDPAVLLEELLELRRRVATAEQAREAAVASVDAEAVYARERARADADLRNTELLTENAGLKRKVRSLSDQVTSLEQQVHGRAAYDDPVEQTRHEIELAWLHSTTADDRTEHPLVTDYTFGPDFLTSLNLPGVEREKVIAVCADVACLRVWKIHGRDVHQLRVSETGGSPTLVREDGATAWRAAIQQNTPSARRLMWWTLTDGSVEFAKVAVHDDYSIR